MCFYHADEGDWDENDESLTRHGLASDDATCDDCEGRILAGDRVRLTLGTYQSRAFVIRVCVPCQTFRAAVRGVEEEEGCTGDEAEPRLGDLFDAVEDDDPERHAAYWARCVEDNPWMGVLAYRYGPEGTAARPSRRWCQPRAPQQFFTKGTA
jgi:hypothetical protein